MIDDFFGGGEFSEYGRWQNFLGGIPTMMVGYHVFFFGKLQKVV